MSDCISRQKALDEWNGLSERGRTEFDQVLMMLPSAQSEPDKGHWIRDTSHGFGVFNWKCSKCGHIIVATTPDRYCGACGCDNNINKEMTKAWMPLPEPAKLEND